MHAGTPVETLIASSSIQATDAVRRPGTSTTMTLLRRADRPHGFGIGLEHHRSSEKPDGADVRWTDWDTMAIGTAT